MATAIIWLTQVYGLRAHTGCMQWQLPSVPLLFEVLVMGNLMAHITGTTGIFVLFNRVYLLYSAFQRVYKYHQKFVIGQIYSVKSV